MRPIISVADEGFGEMCFPAGLNYPFILPLEKFAYMAYKDILSRKSSHKDTSISVIFRTFLLGKLINSVDPQGNTSSHQVFVSSSGNNCRNICRYAYHLNKILQGFVQRKLDKFDRKLALFVIICNCGTCDCHFPFVFCFNRYKYK